MTVELETDNETIKIGPYCCAFEAMVENSTQLKTVGHIPRDISRHAYFFQKEENSKIVGSVYSMKCLPSPIPAGGLEVRPLLLTFKSTRCITHKDERLHHFDILIRKRC